MTQTKTQDQEPIVSTYDYRAEPGAATPANDQVGAHFASFALAEVGGEPRVRDVDLAERLGFDRPRKIRDLISRHLAEVTGLGVCPAVGRTSGPKGGRPATEYYLNEEQALLVAVLSNTSAAREVRRVLIQTFVAYRRGQLVETGRGLGAEDRRAIGGIVKGVNRGLLNEALAEILPSMVSAMIEADPRIGAVTHRPALEVLQEHGVVPKGRRGLSQRVSCRLRRFSLSHGYTMREGQETGRWLFHVDAIEAWLKVEGAVMIRNHKAKLAGDGDLFRLSVVKS